MNFSCARALHSSPKAGSDLPLRHRRQCECRGPRADHIRPPSHLWLGRIPTAAEYTEAVGVLSKVSANIYKCMNFDQIEEYVEKAKETAV